MWETQREAPANWLKLEWVIEWIRNQLMKKEELKTLWDFKEFLSWTNIKDKDLKIQLLIIQANLTNYIKAHWEDWNFMSFIRTELTEKETFALAEIVSYKWWWANLALALEVFEKEENFWKALQNFTLALHGADPREIKNKVKWIAKKEADNLRWKLDEEKNTKKQIIYIRAAEIFTHIFVEWEENKKFSFEWLKQTEIKELTYWQVLWEVAKWKNWIYERIFKKSWSSTQDNEVYLTLQALANQKKIIWKIVWDASKLEEIKLEDIMISIWTKWRSYWNIMKKLSEVKSKWIEEAQWLLSSTVWSIKITDDWKIDLSWIRTEEEKLPKFLSISDIDEITAKNIATSHIIDLSNPEQVWLLNGLINQKSKTPEKDKEYLKNITEYKWNREKWLVKMLSDLTWNNSNDFFDFFLSKESPLDIATIIRFYEKTSWNNDVKRMDPFLQAELLMMLFGCMKAWTKRWELVTAHIIKSTNELIPPEVKDILWKTVEQLWGDTIKSLRDGFWEAYWATKWSTNSLRVITWIGLLTWLSILRLKTMLWKIWLGIWVTLLWAEALWKK